MEPTNTNQPQGPTPPTPETAAPIAEPTIIQPTVVTPTNVTPPAATPEQPLNATTPLPVSSGFNGVITPPAKPFEGDTGQGGSGSFAETGVVPPKPSKKKWYIGGAVAAVLVIAGVGFYFGYYMKPSVVYSSALSRSGKGLDSLADYAQEQSKVNYKSTAGDGNFKFTSKAFSTDGTFAFKSDSKNSETTFDVGLGTTRLNADIRTITASGSTPDIYAKASGIKGLGAMISPEFGAQVDSLDGQWIMVDHSLLDTLANSEAGSSATPPNLPSRAQVLDEVDAFQSVNKQYVFTGKKDKSVFTVLDSYGKEQSDGRTVFRYKVALQKDNTKAYIAAQHDALLKSKLGDWIKQGKYTDQVDKSFKEAEDSTKDIKSSDTFDLYVDASKRIVYKVRLNGDKNPAKNYVDFGFDYKNGDTLPFFISGTSNESGSTTDGSLKATIDTKSNKVKLDFNLKESGAEAGTMTGTFNFKPSTEAVKIETPTGAKQLSEVLQQLGLGDIANSLANPSSNTKAIDSKRQVDIKALQTQLEGYYAEKGSYPSLAQMNDAAWRKANMPNLDETALKDPQGTSSALAGAPAANVYSYQPVSNNAAYTLTATLSDGTAFTKTSLN